MAAASSDLEATATRAGWRTGTGWPGKASGGDQRDAGLSEEVRARDKLENQFMSRTRSSDRQKAVKVLYLKTYNLGT